MFFFICKFFLFFFNDILPFCLQPYKGRKGKTGWGTVGEWDKEKELSNKKKKIGLNWLPKYSWTSRCGLARPINLGFGNWGLHGSDWLSWTSNKGWIRYTSGEFEGEVSTTNALLFFLNHSWTISFTTLKCGTSQQHPDGLQQHCPKCPTVLPHMPFSHPAGWYQVFPSQICIHGQPSTSSGHLLPSSGAHVYMDRVFSGEHEHPACSTVILPHLWHLSIIRISINHLSSCSHGSWSVGSHHLGQSLLCFSFVSVSLDCPWNCYRFSIVTAPLLIDTLHSRLETPQKYRSHLTITVWPFSNLFLLFFGFFCHLLVFVWLPPNCTDCLIAPSIMSNPI